MIGLPSSLSHALIQMCLRSRSVVALACLGLDALPHVSSVSHVPLSARRAFVQEIEVSNAKRAWFVEWRGFRVDLDSTKVKVKAQLDAQNATIREVEELKASIAHEMVSMDMVSTLSNTRNSECK